MKQQLTKWQHMPSNDQVVKEPEKNVSNLLQSQQIPPREDLMGLSWILLEDAKILRHNCLCLLDASAYHMTKLAKAY